MSVSRYEAIAAYDMEHRAEQDSTRDSLYILIVESESCGVGLCKCDNNSVSLVEQFECETSFSSYDECEQTSLEQYRLDTQAFGKLIVSSALRKDMWTYYNTEKCIDKAAFSPSPGAGALSFSQIDRIFEPFVAHLNYSIDRMLDFIENHSIDESGIRIVIFGRLAATVPVQYTVRKAFTFDPFMSLGLDKRFILTENWPDLTAVIAEGTELLQRNELTLAEVSMSLTGSDGTEGVSLELMKKGVSASAYAQPSYSEPIFVSSKDKLRFQINQRDVSYDLPYEIGLIDGDLIEVACRAENKMPIIMIRRTLVPTNVFKIEPKESEWQS